MQTRPTLVSLVCSSYPSDRDFASDFLQILPHSRHPCHWLVVPTTKPTTDFHRQVVAHAGHTKKKCVNLFLGLRIPTTQIYYIYIYLLFLHSLFYYNPLIFANTFLLFMQ